MQQEKKSEERRRILVEIRWRDCFKFWLSALIVGLIPALIVLLLIIATVPWP